MTTVSETKNVGKVVQVIGPVLDVEFEPERLPDLLSALAKDFSIPVITTYKAKGVFPEADALSLGAAGLSPAADKRLMR